MLPNRFALDAGDPTMGNPYWPFPTPKEDRKPQPQPDPKPDPEPMDPAARRLMCVDDCAPYWRDNVVTYTVPPAARGVRLALQSAPAFDGVEDAQMAARRSAELLAERERDWKVQRAARWSSLSNTLSTCADHGNFPRMNGFGECKSCLAEGR